MKHGLDRRDAGALLVVGADHRPGRELGVGLGQRLADRLGIVVPFLQPVDVDPAQLPLLQRIVLAGEETAKLLGAADIQPELDEDDALIDQHLLEPRKLLEEKLALFGRAEAEDMLDHAAVVPGAVEKCDLPGGGQPVDIALEVPLRRLALRRLRQRDDIGVRGGSGSRASARWRRPCRRHRALRRPPRAACRCPCTSACILASSICSASICGVVVLALHLLAVGISSRQDVVLAAHLDRLADLVRAPPSRK